MGKRGSGFTIVELLIVIVVIGILAAIIVVAYNGIQTRAASVVLQNDLRQAATQLENDKTENNDQYANNADSLPKSENTTYQYTTDGTTYCLTGTSSVSGVVGYYVSSSTNSVIEGLCDGHSGPGEEVASQPESCPTGFIPVPGNATFGTNGGFCVMKYEARDVSSVATSQATGTPWVSITPTNAITAATTACSGCHLISESEWLTIAHNVLNVDSNWSGGSVGNGYIYSGHNDASSALIAASSDDGDGYYLTGNTAPSNQRRTLTLSNGEVIWDLAGNAWEITQGTIAGNQQPGLASDSGNSTKQYNDPGFLLGGLPSSAVPSFGTPSASGWDATDGIGALISDYSSVDTTTRAFRRGGNWGSPTSAGIFTLTVRYGLDVSHSHTGFRAVQ